MNFQRTNIVYIRVDKIPKYEIMRTKINVPNSNNRLEHISTNPKPTDIMLSRTKSMESHYKTY